MCMPWKWLGCVLKFQLAVVWAVLHSVPQQLAQPDPLLPYLVQKLSWKRGLSGVISLLGA